MALITERTQARWEKLIARIEALLDDVERDRKA
jgi:hypothetical protein